MFTGRCLESRGVDFRAAFLVLVEDSLMEGDFLEEEGDSLDEDSLVEEEGEIRINLRGASSCIRKKTELRMLPVAITH
jgi:hypothetical protein